MAIINKQVFLAAFLLVASSLVDAASVRGSEKNKQQFLHHAGSLEEEVERTTTTTTRKLKGGKDKSKGKDSSKGSGGGGGTTTVTGDTNTFVPPTSAPVPSGPKLDDWIDQCRMFSRDVDDCVSVGGASTFFNCKMCLKSLAFTSADASNSGVLRCAQGGTCSGCSADDIRPFFACGLEVEAAFKNGNGNNGNIIINLPADPNAVIVLPADPIIPVVVPVVPTAPVVSIDTKNCPWMWPGSGTQCVMINGFDFKDCSYPEEGIGAKCGCSKEQPIWLCTGKTTVDLIVVEKDDLTVVVVDEPVMNGGGGTGGTTSTTTTTTATTTTTVDAEISSGEQEQEQLPPTNTYPVALLCPPAFQETGNECYTGGFEQTTCCYEDPAVVGGTITCTCSDDDNNVVDGLIIGFQCVSGEMSTCTL